MSDSQNRLPQPGAQHELLKPFEGTFRARVKIFTGQGDPIETAGTMVNQFIMGGLYLSEEFKGDTSDGPFPDFEGKGFWGYNFQSQKYEGFWIDNVSSIMQREDGEVDATGKKWEMHSEIEHPHAGTLTKRTVIELIDENHHKVSAYMTPPGGSEMLSMELSYERT